MQKYGLFCSLWSYGNLDMSVFVERGKSEYLGEKLNPLMVLLLGLSNISVRRVVFFFPSACMLLGKRPADFCKRQRSKPMCENKLSWVNLSFWPDLNFGTLMFGFQVIAGPPAKLNILKFDHCEVGMKKACLGPSVSVFHLYVLITESNLSMSESQTHCKKSVLLTLGAPRDIRLRGIRTFQP